MSFFVCGDTHQELAIPVFEDGYVMLSMRKWAEIMEKAWLMSHDEAPRFYLASLCEEKEVLPQQCIIE